jgi:hypothetical protein
MYLSGNHVRLGRGRSRWLRNREKRYVRPGLIKRLVIFDAATPKFVKTEVARDTNSLLLWKVDPKSVFSRFAGAAINAWKAFGAEFCAMRFFDVRLDRASPSAETGNVGTTAGEGFVWCDFTGGRNHAIVVEGERSNSIRPQNNGCPRVSKHGRNECFHGAPMPLCPTVLLAGVGC